MRSQPLDQTAVVLTSPVGQSGQHAVGPNEFGLRHRQSVTGAFHFTESNGVLDGVQQVEVRHRLDRIDAVMVTVSDRGEVPIDGVIFPVRPRRHLGGTELVASVAG